MVFKLSICTLLVCCVILAGGQDFQPQIDVTSFYQSYTNQSIDFQMYAGYQQVRPNDKTAQIFYQLATPSSALIGAPNPIIVWLQGGPGCSSWYGNLGELGPFTAAWNTSSQVQLNLREYRWNKNYYTLFVDQPLGVAYSNNVTPPLNSTIESAPDFEQFLVQFFKTFPELASNDLYLFGESYAGHYVPYYAYHISGNRETNKINLKGIGVGDGLTEFKHQMNYAEFAYAVGTISSQSFRDISLTEFDAITAIKNEQWSIANDLIDLVQVQVVQASNGISLYDYTAYDLSSLKEINEWQKQAEIEDLIQNQNMMFLRKANKQTNVGSINNQQRLNLYNNIIKERTAHMNEQERQQYQDLGDPMQAWLNSDAVQQAFSVPSSMLWTGCDDGVFQRFAKDIPQSFAYTIPPLLDNNVKVMIFAGQNDVICNDAGELAWLNDIAWRNLALFRAVQKEAVNIDGNVYGTFQNYNLLTYVTIYNAGHMVPSYQGLAAIGMVNYFINDSWPKGQTIQEIEKSINEQKIRVF